MSVFGIKRLPIVAALLCAAAVIVAFLVGAWQKAEDFHETGIVQQFDFTVFWGAARLALDGNVMGIYDPATLSSAQGATEIGLSTGYDWRYPPTFLLFLAPFGAMPMLASYVLFGLLGLTLFYAMLRSSAPDSVVASLFIVGSSSAYLNLDVGNCSLFWGACFLAAMIALERRSDIVAGLLLGLLTMKPQLALMIPVALIAAGAWRAFAWAWVSAIGLVLISIAVFGIVAWEGFFNTIGMTVSGSNGRFVVLSYMTTWYALATSVGPGQGFGLLVQGVATLLAAGAVGYAWSRKDAPHGYRVSVLGLAVLVGTPYAYGYELILPMLAMLYYFGLRWLWLLHLPFLIGLPLVVLLIAPPLLTLALLSVTILARPGRTGANRQGAAASSVLPAAGE